MRKLTVRERVLLVILAIVSLCSGYVFLFHLPMVERTAELQLQIAEQQDIAAQNAIRLAEQQRMEQELEQIFAEQADPAEMPEYDNFQAVMVELDRIMSAAEQYTLSFSTTELDAHVMCRKVTMPFRCTSYASAKSILQRLHDSRLRCMIEDFSLSDDAQGEVQVTASVIFYEYRAEAASDATPDAAEQQDAV